MGLWCDRFQRRSPLTALGLDNPLSGIVWSGCPAKRRPDKAASDKDCVMLARDKFRNAQTPPGQQSTASLLRSTYTTANAKVLDEVWAFRIHYLVFSVSSFLRTVPAGFRRRDRACWGLATASVNDSYRGPPLVSIGPVATVWPSSVNEMLLGGLNRNAGTSHPSMQAIASNAPGFQISHPRCIRPGVGLDPGREQTPSRGAHFAHGGWG